MYKEAIMKKRNHISDVTKLINQQPLIVAWKLLESVYLSPTVNENFVC